jgi:hypothetical protein
MRTHIMYIEAKQDLTGPARIGRVLFSKSGKTIYYGERALQSLKGSGYKANYFDVQTGECFWVSKCRRDGHSRVLSDNNFEHGFRILMYTC